MIFVCLFCFEHWWWWLEEGGGGSMDTFSLHLSSCVTVILKKKFFNWMIDYAVMNCNKFWESVRSFFSCTL